MHLLEHMHGTGMVTAPDGNEMRVTYDVRITRDEPDGEAGQPGTPFKHLAGRIWSDTDPYFVLRHVRKTMTLKMEDGRKFRFFHRDADGHIGLSEWIG
jgi:hypothetical protein